MKSSARRSHSNFEGVMIFQRGDSMFALCPPPPGHKDGLLDRIPGCGPIDLAQERIEVLLAEEPVAVHRMPLRQDFPRPFPVAEGVRGDPEVLGGLGDPQEVPQLGHATASTKWS